jgi:AcrR family transcriptional regulator
MAEAAAKLMDLPPSQTTDTRRKLLLAAERIIGRRGFHRTQVTDITQGAGVSTGVFYRYFDSKEQILRALLDGHFSALLDAIRTMRRSINLAAPAEKWSIIKRLFELAFTYNLDRRDAFACWYIHGQGVSEDVERMIHGFVTDLESIIAADIRGSTLIHAPHPEALAECIVGMTLSMIHRMVTRGTPDIETAVSECARFMAGGLLAYAPIEVYTAMANQLKSS